MEKQPFIVIGRPLRAALLAFAMVLAAGLPSPAAAKVDALRTEIDVGRHADVGRLTELGRFFETADPESRDLSKALDLYCRAAAAAHPEALSRLGWLYAKGLGVAQDEGIAATMFRWAAALGHQPASGLAAATAGGADAPPPCLVRHGADSLATLRSISSAAASPGSGATDASAAMHLPTPVVENPAQFRTDPPSAEHQRLVQLVVKEAGRFRLDPRLVLAVMQTESNFDARARSPKNAQGLMQLIPDTARRFKVRDVTDPLENMRGGMAYLRWLLDYYHGDVVLALAAYNSGEGTVDRYRGVPPYRETIAYVQRIRAMYPFDRHPFEATRQASGDRAWVVDGLASANLPALTQAQ